jgi:putative oxidoreductase
MRLDIGLLVLRLGFGGTILLGHGLGKLMGYSTMAATFADPLGMGGKMTLILAIFAEFFCSLLVVIGLSARLATIPLIGTMLSAFLIVHAADPFRVKEMALLYLFAFVTLLLTGPGTFSIDGMIRVKRMSRP